LNDLQALIRQYDFIIGTRLHMCLLAWINNVPAFNISYEEKGRESYRYLGLDAYTIDFNATDILTKLPTFLRTANKKEIFNRVDKVSQEQQALFASLENNDFE
ncbi:polysaccharide pyruvyl transferase family protein, partial [Salmonella enterica subsp. enterica serovar Stanley]